MFIIRRRMDVRQIRIRKLLFIDSVYPYKKIYWYIRYSNSINNIIKRYYVFTWYVPLVLLLY